MNYFSGMASFKFKNLSIGAKLLITLLIPMAWLLVLTGKLVIANLDRHNVFEYIRDQSLNTEIFSNVIHELQKEKALSVGFIAGKTNNTLRLDLQFEQSDAAINKLIDPYIQRNVEYDLEKLFFGLEEVRKDVLANRTTPDKISVYYQRINRICLENLSDVSKLDVDPSTKNNLYAHLSLLYAKEALGVIRSELSEALSTGVLGKPEYAFFAKEVGKYENNMFQFERDASSELLANYQEVFKGSDVFSMRTMINTVYEEQDLGEYAMDPEKWWELSTVSMDRLKMVEDWSLDHIISATEDNLQFARQRLALVVTILVFILFVVTLLSILIWRDIRRSIRDVQAAAEAISKGNVNVKVVQRTNDEFGALAISFNQMIENIERSAETANKIGKGDLDTEVEIRSEGDVLGAALAKMKDDLRSAKEKDRAQTILLQEDKEKMEEANEQIRMLIKEIHHRVKNNLQVIASLLRLQSSSIEDPKLHHMFDQSQNRVRSMALIHEKLYRGAELNELSVSKYLEELISELIRVNDVRDSIKFNIEIPDIDLGLSTMVPLGLLMNELVTNSFKHAFVGKDKGLITVKITDQEKGLFLVDYSDDGVGIPKDKLEGGHDSLGVELIDSLVDQMNGEIKVDTDTSGTHYEITFRTT